MNYKETIRKGVRQLEELGISGSLAQLLMLAYCEEENIDLYADYECGVPAKLAERYLQGLKRLSKHEPLAYVLGYDQFFGYDFIIDRRVFIPRPETEELTNEVLAVLDEEYADYRELTGLDLGTGSGVIAITLALEDARVSMTACDISAEALAVAAANGKRHKVAVRFINSDLFSGLPANQLFDFIVCNPPYIKDDEEIDNSVKDFEPALALYGGAAGLDYYKRILSEAGAYLKPEGFLAFEIAYDQAEVLTDLAVQSFPESRVLIKKDMMGKDRMLFIINKQ